MEDAMLTRLSRPSLCFAMILGLSAGWGPDGRAASLYTVTDLSEMPASQAAEIQALHPSLGLTLSDADKAALPSITVLQGVANPIPRSFQLNPSQNTDSGFVLGTTPSGGDRANPLNMMEYDYTQKTADGE